MSKKQEELNKMLDYAGRQHLKHARMTYVEHFGRAGQFSLLGLKLTFKAIIHGIVPGLFGTCAIDSIKEMTKKYGPAKVKAALAARSRKKN